MFFNLIFHWRRSALQCCVGFCRAAWMCSTHACPHSWCCPQPAPPLRSSCWAPGWARCGGTVPLAVCLTRGRVRVSVLLSQFIPGSFPTVSESPFPTAVSIPAPQIGSSVPFLDSMYMRYGHWQMIKDVRICSGILLSHKEEAVRVSWTEVDEPRACYTEWSQRENLT